jgi:bacteriorhodopsin
MLNITAYSSLFIQLITGVIDILGLSIDVPDNKIIFKDLLKVELFVQSIEFIFYVWMVFNLYTIKNITPYRYMDWFITTPIMLVTFIAYLDNNNYNNLLEYITNNKAIIIQLVLLNIFMLLFGLLGELKYIPYLSGILLGFIPFIYYFKIIYDKYIKKDISRGVSQDVSQDKRNLYWFFLIIWTLYGLAAFMPYILKNTIYNILDLFAKNGFGVFLVYILWSNRIQK